MKNILELKILFSEIFKKNYLEGLKFFDFLEDLNILSPKIFLMILLFLSNPNRNKQKIISEKIKIVKYFLNQAKEKKGKFY